MNYCKTTVLIPQTCNEKSVVFIYVTCMKGDMKYIIISSIY